MVERVAVRPFVARGSNSWLIATVALGIVLENVVLFTFGKDPRGMPPGVLTTGSITIATQLGICLAMIASLRQRHLEPPFRVVTEARNQHGAKAGSMRLDPNLLARVHQLIEVTKQFFSGGERTGKDGHLGGEPQAKRQLKLPSDVVAYYDGSDIDPFYGRYISDITYKGTEYEHNPCYRFHYELPKELIERLDAKFAGAEVTK